MLAGWMTILISPSQLMTDYFRVGGVSSSFFNAAVCTFACWMILIKTKAPATPSFLASYILLAAHCFYGMNFINIWPCYFGVLFYYHLKKKDFREHLHIAMFTMAFGPMISELLFRYPLGDAFVPGQARITLIGVILALAVGMTAGLVLPGMLEGALWMHKGYNLYNGGLAFGLIGMFLYEFLYDTLGFKTQGPVSLDNRYYDGIGEVSWVFVDIVFILFFIVVFIVGYIMNDHSAKGYKQLMSETGHFSNFADKYGMPLCLINMGVYGMMILVYMNLVMVFTEGVAFTGPTVGAILAALTFSAIGQHPKNTWSIFLGYIVLYVFVVILCTVQGRPVPWTLSMQGYINGVAFATGLAPIPGRYGWRCGVIAGIVSATICTATSAIHGGFMIFNGGFSAGITALVVISVLEHHFPHMKVKGI